MLSIVLTNMSHKKVIYISIKKFLYQNYKTFSDVGINSYE